MGTYVPSIIPRSYSESNWWVHIMHSPTKITEMGNTETIELPNMTLTGEKIKSPKTPE